MLPTLITNLPNVNRKNMKVEKFGNTRQLASVYFMNSDPATNFTSYT